MLKGAIKDKQTVLPDGSIVRDLIDGVKLKPVSNIVTRNGLTTEVYRDEWKLWDGNPRHVIHVSFRAHAISAWHCHQHQTDNIFVTDGSLRLALYDARPGSPTQGKLNVFNLSRANPMIVVVPPMIWHGTKNLENSASGMINFFDRAYVYEDPDEWRLPEDTDQIPYRF